MRITIDIPEWAQERHIYIMAGIEMLAFKPYGEDVLHVKTARCKMCGDCCSNLKVCLEPIGPDNNCIWLERPLKEGNPRECLLGMKRPFVCSTTIIDKKQSPVCSIEYQEIPL